MPDLVVTEVTPCGGENVRVEGVEWQDHIRYSSDYWMVMMGESLEPVFDCANLEKAYQEFIVKGRKRNADTPNRVS